MPVAEELPIRWLVKPDGTRLAYLLRESGKRHAGLLWLGGLRSDMAGTKATALDAFAAAEGLRLLRFDYSGHGRSEGAFAQGTIGRWLDDALFVVDRLAHGPQIVLGSSMGAWLALLLARARPERVKALLLIAPAVDFTETLMWARFDARIRAEICARGSTTIESVPQGAEPYPVTRALIEEGRNHLLLGKPFAFAGPVRILQGLRDEQVPWTHAVKVLEMLSAPDAVLSLVKDGDHGLSDPRNLARLTLIVTELCALWEGAS
jgi:pimeloyl-ACP methyl ester carboxylesterase